MSEHSHFSESQIAAHEINISRLAMLDVCYTAKAIIDEALARPDSIVEDSVSITGVPVDQSLVPDAMTTITRGTRFSKLDIVYDKRFEKSGAVRIVGHDALRPGRTVTFTELPDRTEISVEDSHDTLFALRDRALATEADQLEISRFLAAQVEGKSMSYEFLKQGQHNALRMAAAMLELRGESLISLEQQLPTSCKVRSPHGGYAPTNTWANGSRRRCR